MVLSGPSPHSGEEVEEVAFYSQDLLLRRNPRFLH
jgi:hypothetical protein